MTVIFYTCISAGIADTKTCEKGAIFTRLNRFMVRNASETCKDEQIRIIDTLPSLVLKYDDRGTDRGVVSHMIPSYITFLNTPGSSRDIMGDIPMTNRTRVVRKRYTRYGPEFLKREPGVDENIRRLLI